MGFSTNVRVDEAQLEEAKALLANIQNGFWRAYSRALNNTTTAVRQHMVEIASLDYTYKVAAVKSRAVITKSTWSNMVSKIVSKGSGVHLTDMLGTRQTSTGLSINIKRDTGIKYLRHGFIRTVGSKKIAFWRAAPGDDLSSKHKAQLEQSIAAGHISKTTGLVWRTPIVALYAPHPEIVWNTEENWRKIEANADDQLQAQFAKEVDGVLRQYS